MKVFEAIAFLVFLLININCKSQENPKKANDEAFLNANNHSSAILNTHVLPDTSFNAMRAKDITEYLKPYHLKISLFCDSIANKGEGFEEQEKIKQEFDNIQHYLWYKLILKSPKNVWSINMLSFGSPYDKYVSVEERLTYFSLYPLNIQTSPQGMKTLKILNEFKKDKNVGNYFFEKHNLVATNDLMQLVRLNRNTFSNKKKLFLFGATYCIPCIQQERKLKNEYDKIDTSKVEVIVFSVDKEPISWYQYTKKENFPWRSYVLEKQMNNLLIKKLNFESIPKNFLVDTTDKILKESITYEDFLDDIFLSTLKMKKE